MPTRSRISFIVLFRSVCVSVPLSAFALSALKAIQAEKPSSVVDLCTGRGLTLLAAHKFGARFYGTELNKRRLAVAIDRASKAGVFYEKCDIQ